MYGDQINYDSVSERATLSDAEFVMYEQQLYGIAESVTRDANGSLEIEDGQLTFCAPTDPSWPARICGRTESELTVFNFK